MLKFNVWIHIIIIFVELITLRQSSSQILISRVAGPQAKSTKSVAQEINNYHNKWDNTRITAHMGRTITYECKAPQH
jgi:hypothetical protein